MPPNRASRTGLPIIPKEPPRPSARCAEPPPPELLAGIAQFNAGDFWHCHETLEAIWRVEPDPIRSLYQGILLVGVGYYHLRRDNRRGAISKLAQGLERLAPFRPTCMGVDVEALAHAATATLDGLRTAPELAAIPAAPQIRLRPDHSAAGTERPAGWAAGIRSPVRRQMQEPAHAQPVAREREQEQQREQ